MTSRVKVNAVLHIAGTVNTRSSEARLYLLYRIKQCEVRHLLTLGEEYESPANIIGPSSQ